MNLFQEFKWRGVLYDATEGCEKMLTEEKISGYIGFDPTAATLHVGSLMPIMGLARMQRAGHSPIALVGGGTGLIGDPSGKTEERQLLTKEKVEENLDGIRNQLSRFLDFEVKSNPAKMVNNYEWLGSISFVDFLRDVGKYFTVNHMLSKESVKRRIESQDGITYTEFSYMLLQAYDFLVLNDRHDCALQMGGSDQWGNILAGSDLVRRLRAKKAHGLVFPLVVSSSGVKFGKTEGNPIWLDAEQTSPYRFYQFFLNTDDADTIRYLKYFTWLDETTIGELAAEMEANPHQRAAQKRLAQEVTQLVHGESELARAERASKVLFGGDIEGLSAGDILDIFQDVPSSDVQKTNLEGDGIKLVDLMADSGIAKSKGEARRLLQGGGVYLNNRQISEDGRAVTMNDSVEGQFMILRKGRKNYHLLKVV